MEIEMEHSKQCQPPPNNFSNKAMLYRGFIKKVLSILSIQLLITGVFILINQTSSQFHELQRTNRVLIFLCFFITLAVMITLYCYRRKARTVPTNYILLSAFTLAEAYLISATTSFYDQETIVIAFLITFLLVSILTLISCFGKFVITQKLNLLIFLPIALIVLIIYRIYFQSRIVRIIISLLIIFMYSVFIVYDLQRMTGKKANGYNVDDYIIASLDLYIDIILVFQELLRLIGSKA